jgi:pimeloyl-ACP methyl ester carboxylesterase
VVRTARAHSGPARRVTFVPIHAAGDGAWSWHLVAAELRELGHHMVAIDLPAADESLSLWDYADAVVRAVKGHRNVVVVAHSFGGFTGPLVCQRRPVDLLVLVTAMIPAAGERPDDWWSNTGHTRLKRRTGLDDLATYYHDVPPALASEAMKRARAHPSARAGSEPWPLKAWPNVPTRFLLCRNDRLFPAAWMRRLVGARLGITPDEIDSGHCPMLSRPKELADRLVSHAVRSDEHENRIASRRT